MHIHFIEDISLNDDDCIYGKRTENKKVRGMSGASSIWTTMGKISYVDECSTIEDSPKEAVERYQKTNRNFKFIKDIMPTTQPKTDISQSLTTSSDELVHSDEHSIGEFDSSQILFGKVF